MTDPKDFLPCSHHFTGLARRVKSRVKHCYLLSFVSVFFFFANLAKSDAIKDVNYFIKLRQLFCLKVSCRHLVGEE